MSALQGKVALVTGGAGGLGTAISRMLLAEGATAVVADVRREQAELVVTTLLTEHPAQPLVGSAEPLALDVTSEASAEAAIQMVLERHGRLDILVNNAG